MPVRPTLAIHMQGGVPSLFSASTTSPSWAPMAESSVAETQARPLIRKAVRNGEGSTHETFAAPLELHSLIVSIVAIGFESIIRPGRG